MWNRLLYKLFQQFLTHVRETSEALDYGSICERNTTCMYSARGLKSPMELQRTPYWS